MVAGTISAVLVAVCALFGALWAVWQAKSAKRESTEALRVANEQAASVALIADDTQYDAELNAIVAGEVMAHDEWAVQSLISGLRRKNQPELAQQIQDGLGIKE